MRLRNQCDLARLAEPLAALGPLGGLVVIDELRHRPDLLAAQRVLAGRRGMPARSLPLGSASPDRLPPSPEALAGRIAYHELDGLSAEEVGHGHRRRLRVRGGVPASFLARDEGASRRWRASFVRTQVERDLPLPGLRLPPATLRRAGVAC